MGLDGADVAEMLATTQFTEAVRKDEADARQLGVRGVPFFAIDRKFGVSGAQHSAAFLGALNQAWETR